MKKSDRYEGKTVGSGSIVQSSRARSPVAPQVDAFCHSVAQRFDPGDDFRNITDNFFLWIESDRALLSGYEELESGMGSQLLNAQVGRWIKDHYGLGNGDLVTRPKSRLIRAYTSHYRLG